MHLSPLDLAIFLIYMAAVLGLGLLAARRGTKTKREYFLAGDKLPWWMIGGSIVAANISSHQLVGSMGVAYSRGFVAMVTEWGMILVGLNALLWIFLPFYLRNGFYTVPEYLNRRFGPSVRTTYAVLILLTYMLVEIGAVLYMGSLAVNSLLGIRLSYSIIALAAVTGIYTILGGLRAVVWTEMLQLTILLLGGIALSVATIHRVGGFHAALVASGETTGKWHLLLPANDPDFPWTMYLGGTLCISIFYAAANQFIVQRTLAAKNEWHARIGIIFTDYLKFLIPMIIIVPGLLAPSLFPHLPKADYVFPTLVKNLLPTGAVGLVMAGLIAAVMGHTSGAINSVTTIATMDFYVPWKARRGGTDAQAVRFGRIFGIFTIIIGVICAELLTEHAQKPIFLYLMAAYGYFTPGIATMFLVGILWKRTTTAGAMAAGILTIPMSAFIQWKWPSFPFQNRTGVVFWSCIVVCILVSLITTPKSAEELTGLIWTRDSLNLPAAERAQYRGFRRPFFWWAIITAIVIFFYVRFA
jgi:SSS family solute:Na+ symporter